MRIILAALLVLLLPTALWASDVSLAVTGGIYFPTDTQFQEGRHIQINLKWKNIYTFGSYTMTERRIAGQGAGEFNIFGIGGGLHIPITKNLSMWGQVGYYMPKSNLTGSTQDGDWYTGANNIEVHYLYWNQWGTNHQYNVQNYGIYECKLVAGNIGGALGLNLVQPISKKIDVGISLAYMFLRFKETFYARYAPCPTVSYIQTRQDVKLDGGILGISITYRF
jgi:hypothetical protein